MFDGSQFHDVITGFSSGLEYLQTNMIHILRDNRREMERRIAMFWQESSTMLKILHAETPASRKLQRQLVRVLESVLRDGDIDSIL